MRGLGTDHVISGPIRGLEKNCIRWRRPTDRQKNKLRSGHRDSMTDLDRVSENQGKCRPPESYCALTILCSLLAPGNGL